MSANVKVGGTWQVLQSLHVKVGGTWQAVQSGWVKVAGTWQQFYDAVAYNLTGGSLGTNLATQPADGAIGVRINADGTVDRITANVTTGALEYNQIESSTDWCIPNGAVTGNERFRCTDNNANLDGASDATGSWLAAPREWFITESSATPKLLDIDIDLSILGDTNVDETANYTGAASAEP